MSQVYLSPSSSHFNVGYGKYGMEERRMNLIADVAQYDLTRHGITAMRNTPDMTLTEVVADANARNPGLYVAIQSQASNTRQRGAQVYYYKRGGNDERLASDIFENLSAVTPFEDIGVSEGAAMYGGLGFYELGKTKMPAIIVMVGFHDNPLDADFIINNTYEIGAAIAKGILDYLGIPYNDHTPENVQSLKADYNGVTF